MKIKLKQIVYFLIGIVGVGAVAAFQMRIAIGISPWDALGRTISYITKFKVGDVGILQSVACIIIHLFFEVKVKVFISLLVGIILGKLINFFFYYVFVNVVITNYYVALFLFIVCVFLVAFFISIIQTAKFINLPLEGLCEVLAENTRYSFAYLRGAVDVLCVIAVFVLTFVFKVPLTLREGTIISALLFGPLMGVYMPRLEKLVNKYQII